MYKKVVNGQKDLWDKYCRLRKEVKELHEIRKKNFEVLEKANVGFKESRKEFWAIVGRIRKGNKRIIIASLKSDAGVSVASTRDKLEVLQR